MLEENRGIQGMPNGRQCDREEWGEGGLEWVTNDYLASVYVRASSAMVIDAILSLCILYAHHSSMCLCHDDGVMML